MTIGAAPLGLVRPGSRVVVKDLTGEPGMRRRLVEMGLKSGATVVVVKNDSAGPVIVSLGEGRIAVGRGIALRIIVEESGDN